MRTIVSSIPSRGGFYLFFKVNFSHDDATLCEDCHWCHENCCHYIPSLFHVEGSLLLLDCTRATPNSSTDAPKPCLLGMDAPKPCLVGVGPSLSNAYLA